MFTKNTAKLISHNITFNFIKEGNLFFLLMNTMQQTATTMTDLTLYHTTATRPHADS